MITDGANPYLVQQTLKTFELPGADDPSDLYASLVEPCITSELLDTLVSPVLSYIPAMEIVDEDGWDMDLQESEMEQVIAKIVDKVKNVLLNSLQGKTMDARSKLRLVTWMQEVPTPTLLTYWLE